MNVRRKKISLRSVSALLVCVLIGGTVIKNHLLKYIDSLPVAGITYEDSPFPFNKIKVKVDDRAILRRYSFDNMLQIIRIPSQRSSHRLYELVPGTFRLPYKDDKGCVLATVTYEINQYGFRGEAVSPRKLKETLRIGFFGGSAIFGVGLEKSETIPAMVEEKFRMSTNKSIQVLNFGLPRSNGCLDVAQYEYYVHALGFTLNAAFFWITEFVADMPGYGMIRLDDPNHSIALIPVPFDDLWYHYEYIENPFEITSNPYEQPPGPQIGWGSCYGYTLTSKSLNRLVAIAERDGVQLWFILDDPYVIIDGDGTVKRRLDIKPVFSMLVHIAEKKRILTTFTIDDELVKKHHFKSCSELFITRRDLVPIKPKRERVARDLAKLILWNAAKGDE